MADKQVYAPTKQNEIDKFFINTSEKTSRDSSYVPNTFLKPYNPDDLWQKVGSYDIYEEMGKDDQIAICMTLKKDLILTGYDITTEDEGTQDIADDLTKSLKEDVHGDFEDMLEEILTAYDFGFSITEKIFKKRLDESLALKELKTRHPDTWLLHTDQKGVVTKYEQRGVDADKVINPKSLIHFINNQRFQNAYGTSDLRPAYAAYFCKTQIIRYYGIFLEGCAKPIPIARYDTQIGETAKRDLFNTIKQFQHRTAMVIPKAIELEFLEAKSNGEAYSKAIEIFNMFIGRALMCPDLLGVSGSETGGGSYSLGKEQIAMFFRHINRKRSAVERVVNNEIIKPLVKYNYGNVDHFPKFKLRPITEEGAMVSVDKWIAATNARIYRPSDEEIDHFRKLINFPQGDIEREVEPEETEEPTKLPNPANQPMPEEENESDTGGDMGEIDENGKKDFAQKKPFKPTNTQFEARTNFKEVESMLDGNLQKITDELSPVIDFIYNDLLQQIEKKKILQGKPERLDQLKIKKLKEINTILKGRLRENFTESKRMAKKELIKREFAEPLISEAFLKFLDAETFDAVGSWEYDIDESTRVALRAAIKDGKNLADVVQIMDENKDKIKMATERYARTKLTETMNKGRLEFFNDSGVVDGYEYSAIMDGRTSAICSGLHGKKFKKGTEPIPPMHFNCRSILIPITIFEEFTPTEKIKGQTPDAFIDENKGKGFSKR